MIRYKFLAAAAFGLLAALPMAAPSLAQEMGRPPMGGGMHDDHSQFMMLLHSANLTQAQQSQIHVILNSQHEQTRAMHHQLEVLHQQISDKLLSSGSVSAADLKPLVDKASRIEATLNQSRAETAVSIRNVLTADQLNHVAQVHAKLRSLHSQVESLMGHQDGPPDDGND
jgi:Spy/CpxP family protein refolding chaperone